MAKEGVKGEGSPPKVKGGKKGKRAAQKEGQAANGPSSAEEAVSQPGSTAEVAAEEPGLETDDPSKEALDEVVLTATKPTPSSTAVEPAVEELVGHEQAGVAQNGKEKEGGSQEPQPAPVKATSPVPSPKREHASPKRAPVESEKEATEAAYATPTAAEGPLGEGLDKLPSATSVSTEEKAVEPTAERPVEAAVVSPVEPAVEQTEKVDTATAVESPRRSPVRAKSPVTSPKASPKAAPASSPARSPVRATQQGGGKEARADETSAVGKAEGTADDAPSSEVDGGLAVADNGAVKEETTTSTTTAPDATNTPSTAPARVVSPSTSPVRPVSPILPAAPTSFPASPNKAERASPQRSPVRTADRVVAEEPAEPVGQQREEGTQQKEEKEPTREEDKPAQQEDVAATPQEQAPSSKEDSSPIPQPAVPVSSPTRKPQEGSAHVTKSPISFPTRKLQAASPVASPTRKTQALSPSRNALSPGRRPLSPVREPAPEAADQVEAVEAEAAGSAEPGMGVEGSPVAVEEGRKEEEKKEEPAQGELNEGKQVVEEQEQKPAAPEAPVTEAKPALEFSVGEEVDTVWGLGVVKEVRAEGTVVVEAVEWNMAGGQKPLLYLQPNVPRKLDASLIYKEWTKRKKFWRASNLKEQGNDLFRAKQFEAAERKYAESLGVLQCIIEDDKTTNNEKAQRLAITIPVLNNAAACGLKMKQYKSVQGVAGQALAIIEALEKGGGPNILSELTAMGVGNDQMFVKYKKKAASFVGKAKFFAQDYGDAVKYLETAKALAIKDGDTELKSAENKEVLQLLQLAQRKKEDEEKQEKARWQKAFGKLATDEEGGKDDESSGRAESRSATPVPGSGTRKLSSAAGAAKGGADGDLKKKKALATGNNTWLQENGELLGLAVAGSLVLGGFAYYYLKIAKRRS